MPPIESAHRDVQPFDGDPPDDAERDHREEVEHIVWSFNAVTQPGAHVAFCLRNAVGTFAVRKSKEVITIEDAERIKAAVGGALRAARRAPETKTLPHLGRGVAAILESVDAWTKPDLGHDPTAFLRRLLIRILKHEAAAADLASVAADYSPAAWLRRQRRALTAAEV